MTDSLDSPPEPERFDEFIEVAVDGNPAFRVEQRSELTLSDIDDAVIAFIAGEMAADVDEELREKHDMDAEEILRTQQPDVEIFDSNTGEWEAMGDV